MYSEIIISKSLNNIVFEGRNKNYGAYQLRSDYEKHIRQAGLIVLFSISVLLGFSFVKLLSNQKVIPDLTHLKPLIKITKIDLPIIIPPQPVHPAATHHAVAANQPMASGKVIPTEIKQDIKVPEMHETTTTLTTVGDPKEVTTTTTITTEKPTSGGNKNPIAGDNPTNKMPPEFVDQMPEFPGGEAAMMQYLQSKIHFTEQAKILGLEGKVVLNFVVDEDGKISDCTVKRALGGGLDEVAIHVVEKMPHWKPGKQHGKNVAVLFTLPIDFELP